MSEEPKTRKLTGYLAAQIIDRLNRAGSAVQDWDVRLSNARPPTPHAHPAAQISDATPAGRALITQDLAGQKVLLGVGQTGGLTPADIGAVPADAASAARRRARSGGSSA